MLELMAMGISTIHEDAPLNEEAIIVCSNVKDLPSIGNCRSYRYVNHNPQITIGPNCNNLANYRVPSTFSYYSNDWFHFILYNFSSLTTIHKTYFFLLFVSSFCTFNESHCRMATLIMSH